MVGGEILGCGVQVEAESREAYGAIGSTIVSIINILRQIADYAYRISMWLIQQLHDKPFDSIACGLSIVILLS
jgi:hypothetical protein